MLSNNEFSSILNGRDGMLNDTQLEAIARIAKRLNGDFDSMVQELESRDYEYREVVICAGDPFYFINTFIKIYDAQIGDWIEFRLWKEQSEALEIIHTHQLTIALKARQLGMTWLALAYALWQMLFCPIATVLLFSRRDDEAIYLLSSERLKGMYRNLPDFLKANSVEIDSAHQFKLSNDSVAYAFPTTAGDSYTATLVIMDEADLLPDLNRLMRSVKPTIDAGGKLFMLSRSNKSIPKSEFKEIYRAAQEGKNDWAYIFLPWYVRPERTPEWYEAQKREVLSRTGSLDDLFEQYPATDVEALMGKSLDARIAKDWLDQCYVKMGGIEAPGAPAIPRLVVYKEPFQNRVYVGGADPAEGNPTSNDSAATWVDAQTGEEVAKLNGKYEPSLFADYIDQIGKYFNNASVLVERNNHGHAVMLWLELNSNLNCIEGLDEKRGWLDNSLGKTRLYDHCAEMFRDQATIVHSEDSYLQLLSIQGDTLLAPKNQSDDLADSYALALMGMISAFSLPYAFGKAHW
jgi:hypothetical protein